MDLLKFLVNLFFKRQQPQATPTEPAISTPSEDKEQVKPELINESKAKTRYGEIVNQHWANEGVWMTVYVVPEDISSGWINSATGKPTAKIYINKDMKDALGKALSNLKEANLLSELKTFDGLFNIRDVRGVPGKLSWHSYGMAIDLNAAENGLGKTPQLSPEFVKCFTDAGFVWGGHFSRKDGMHFQLAE